MTSLFNCILSLLLGVALAAYGLVHSLTRYPAPTAIATLAGSLPAIGSVVLFALGVLATVAGLILLFTSARRLRLVWRHLRRATETRPSAAGGRAHDGYSGNGYHPDADEREWVGAYR